MVSFGDIAFALFFTWPGILLLPTGLLYVRRNATVSEQRLEEGVPLDWRDQYVAISTILGSGLAVVAGASLIGFDHRIVERLARLLDSEPFGTSFFTVIATIAWFGLVDHTWAYSSREDETRFVILKGLFVGVLVFVSVYPIVLVTIGSAVIALLFSFRVFVFTDSLKRRAVETGVAVLTLGLASAGLARLT
ncbi:hypothetical protein [Halobellus ruber]|uniref:Uncharacterized protein n=1 Tax=Halobellus ruber TaxID=2761102 RepID=A0A7J9SI63_9EURY|nr:hypothetical protein [Halobellus ruber]MBB6646644.1 hypothetical protein [Halobellus ruber]